ncbi:hypothetical protein R1sor_021914 [Riccia sorocarpa]|uniref:NAD(P)H-quinone oxidoreductase subunit L, chloroplastic n=1 Tax=Riccia sorocarpa TaxID=122646 RepID=A0ABD3GID8_9MARC
MAALVSVAPRGLGNLALGSALPLKRARSSLVTVKCSGLRSSHDAFQLAQVATKQLEKSRAERLVENAKDSVLGKALAPVAASVAFYMQIAGPALAEISEAAPVDEVDDEFIIWAIITSGVAGFVYLIVIPLIVYNYLRLRWYKRNALETFFQFMLVFIFFPGMLLLAPFINFRRLPKDGAEAP